MGSVLIVGNLHWTSTPDNTAKLKEFCTTFFQGVDAVIFTGNMAVGFDNLIKLLEIASSSVSDIPILLTLSNAEYHSTEEFAWNENKISLIEACDKYNCYWMQYYGPVLIGDVYIEGVDTINAKEKRYNIKTKITDVNLPAGITNVTIGNFVKAHSILYMQSLIKMHQSFEDYLHTPYHMIISHTAFVPDNDTNDYEYIVSGTNGPAAGESWDRKTKIINAGDNYNFFMIDIGEDGNEPKGRLQASAEATLHDSWIVFDSSVHNPATSGNKNLH